MACGLQPFGLAARPVWPADIARLTAVCGRYSRKHCVVRALATAQGGRTNPSRGAAVSPGRRAAAEGMTAAMVPPAAADGAVVLATTALVRTALVRTALVRTALVTTAVTASLVLVRKLIWLAPGCLGQDAI